MAGHKSPNTCIISFCTLRSVCCNTAGFDLCGLRAGAREREGTKGMRFAARLHCFILFILSLTLHFKFRFFLY